MTDHLLLEICADIPTSQDNTGTAVIQDTITAANTGTPVISDTLTQAYSF